MDNKFLVLLFSYNRPKLIRNALNGLAAQTYQNFEVVVIDDGSDFSPNEIVSRDFPNLADRCGYMFTDDTVEQKIARGGSLFGMYANIAMSESDADVCLWINDDDSIRKDYLENLNKFYAASPSVIYSYSHFILFNPIEEDFEEVRNRTQASAYLNWTHPLNGDHQLDSCQHSYRLKPVVEAGVGLDYPRTVNHDADFYGKMFRVFGPCVFNGIVGPLKGWNSDIQLGKRENWYEGTE